MALLRWFFSSLLRKSEVVPAGISLALTESLRHRAGKEEYPRSYPILNGNGSRNQDGFAGGRQFRFPVSAIVLFIASTR
jgi:hypothetical protein